VPYLSASVMIHCEEALYQVYAPLPLPLCLLSVQRTRVTFLRIYIFTAVFNRTEVTVLLYSCYCHSANLYLA